MRVKNRVFRIGIALLLVLLVFTLLAQTIYTLMLPEVKKQFFSNGPLDKSRTVRFSGTVEQGGRGTLELTDEDLSILLENAVQATVSGSEEQYTIRVEDYSRNDASTRYVTKIVLAGAEGLSPGTPFQAKFFVQEKTQSYTLLPTNCIYSDPQGTFVFVLEEEDTIWGKKQVVRRLDVRVIDSDYLNAAVDIGPYYTVVSSVSNALRDGAEVRLTR